MFCSKDLLLLHNYINNSFINVTIYIELQNRLLIRLKMDIIKTFEIITAFLIGFIVAYISFILIIYGGDIPITKGLKNLAHDNNIAPSDYITEDQIVINRDKIILNINDASLSRYAPTGSMKPLLDENSNGIRIRPKSPEEINIGDIITFESDGKLIVHRIIDKGSDSYGEYYITKGDNNTLSDGLVRFDDIRYKTIGVLW